MDFLGYKLLFWPEVKQLPNILFCLVKILTIPIQLKSFVCTDYYRCSNIATRNIIYL